MKKILYFLIAILFVSCDDFLDTDSKDLIIPEYVDQYSSLLFGEGHIKDDIVSKLEVMTDDVQAYESNAPVSTDGLANIFGYYTWQQQPEVNKQGEVSDDKTWPRLYRSIVICNTIINDYEDIKGDTAEKEYLKAEAHFLRALDYFLLVNIYAPHYSADNLNKGGVPINDLSTIQNVSFVRNTVKEVYDRIISDLETADQLLETASYERSAFRLNKASLYQLFSRVYLYMQEYDKVISYANLSLEQNSSLIDLTIEDAPDINKMNSEINFSYLSTRRSYPPTGYRDKYTMVASDELISLYTENDLRLSQYFNTIWPSNKSSNKTSKQQTYGIDFRVSEVYLNRAEAYAETNQVSKALEDLNTLRIMRISADHELSTTTQYEAIEYVRQERRRELCFEINRWFDLRRWGQPSITHETINEDGTRVAYELKEYDDAYVMPLPIETKKLNPNMQDYPNPVRLPKN